MVFESADQGKMIKVPLCFDYHVAPDRSDLPWTRFKCKFAELLMIISPDSQRVVNGPDAAVSNRLPQCPQRLTNIVFLLMSNQHITILPLVLTWRILPSTVS
jgi:hypothetical protein